MTEPWDPSEPYNPTVYTERERPSSAYTPEVTVYIEGPMGPQGPAGEDGPMGPQGPQGNTGPKGDTGSQGPIGPEGPAGADGTSVTIVGSVANAGALPGGLTGADTGDGYITEDTGNLHVWNGSSFTDVGPIRGPVGPAGPQGPQGSTGPQGPQGPSGLSAYQIAVNNGFVGTEAEWLASLQGEDGTGGGGDSRLYLDGVIATATTFTAGASLLQAPVRIPLSTTIRVFEIRLSKAVAGGSMVFTLYRTTGTSAAVIIGQLTVSVGNTRARIDPNAAVVEGDLLDIFLTTNGNTTTDYTISGTVDNNASAPTTATGTSGVFDDFNRADGSPMGSTSVGGKPWTTLQGTFGILNNRANASGVGENLTRIATGKVEHTVEADMVQAAGADNYWRLVVSVHDAQNFVACEVQNAGELLLTKRIGNVWAPQATLPAGTVTTPATIKLAREANNLYRVSVNGVSKLTATISDAILTNAQAAGLGAGFYGAGGVPFDNFKQT